MVNPFPGMNPYIEANDRWPDFHLTFIATCREQLLEHLPENYSARIDERVQLVDQGDRSQKSYRPDTAVLRSSPDAAQTTGAAATLDLEPISCHYLEMETETVGYIEIITSSNDELITVIELLSPSNKKEPGRSEYLAKMEHLRRGGVHVVEVDLLLGGERLEMREPLPNGDFFAFVARKESYPVSDVFAWSIRRKLPLLPIPLNKPDRDIILDLASAFELTFKRGGYGRDLHYDVPLPATLSSADREWAVSIRNPPAK